MVVNIIRRIGIFRDQIEDQVLVAQETGDIAADTATDNQRFLRIYIKGVNRLQFIRIANKQILMTIGVGIGIFIIEDVHRSHADIQIFVHRQQFQIPGNYPFIHIGSLTRSGNGIVRQDIAFGTRKIQDRSSIDTGNHRFGTEFPKRFSKILAELHVGTLQIALIAFKKFLRLRHVTFTSENGRLVKNFHIRRIESQRAVLLPEITDNPIEIISNIPFDVYPADGKGFGGGREILLHSRAHSEHHISPNKFIRTKMEIDVGIRHFISLRFRHFILSGRILIGVKIRSLSCRANFPADNDSTFRLNGIYFSVQPFLSLPFCCSGDCYGSSKESDQKLFHILFHCLRSLL